MPGTSEADRIASRQRTKQNVTTYLCKTNTILYNKATLDRVGTRE